MPQMAPISWLFLFIIFSITFIMFNIMNYFTFFYTPTNIKTQSSKKTNYLNWKW